MSSNNIKLAQYIDKLLAEWPRKKLIAEVKKTVVGQDDAVEKTCDFFIAACMRARKLAQGFPAHTLPTNNVALIHGPSGSGKTLILETLVRITSINIVRIDGSMITGTGWNGRNLDDEMIAVAKAQEQGSGLVLVFIDEADKLVRVGERDKGFDPCKDFLKIFEATGEVDYGMSSKSGEKPASVNHVGTIYVLAGAFTGIEDTVRKRLSSTPSVIGFGSQAQKPEREYSEAELLKLVNHEDLQQRGFPIEFLGRINTYIGISSLTADAYRQILCDSESSCQTRINAILPSGCTFSIAQEAVDFIASKSMSTGRGARGLNTIVSSITTSAVAQSASDLSISKIILTVKDDELVCETLRGIKRYEAIRGVNTAECASSSDAWVDELIDYVHATEPNNADCAKAS